MRLKSWESKHVKLTKQMGLSELKLLIPEYTSEGCHLLPGSNILLREQEPSSLIAYLLE